MASHYLSFFFYFDRRRNSEIYLSQEKNQMNLSKTNYLVYRDCKKNAWLKIHRPDIYNASQLSEFEKFIIKTGNEVEACARKLFPQGILIEERNEEAVLVTEKYLQLGSLAPKRIGEPRPQVLFQPAFLKDGF